METWQLTVLLSMTTNLCECARPTFPPSCKSIINNGRGGCWGRRGVGRKIDNLQCISSTSLLPMYGDLAISALDI